MPITSATPLKRATKAPELDEKIYLIGYPVKTTNRSNGLNSTGRAAYITKGEYKGPMELSNSYVSPNIFNIKADGCFNTSGGAAVNSLGEVIGIIVSGTEATGFDCEELPQESVGVLSIEHVEKFKGILSDVLSRRKI